MNQIVQLGTAISRAHRHRLDAIRKRRNVSIRSLLEGWIDDAMRRGITRKRRAKA